MRTVTQAQAQAQESQTPPARQLHCEPAARVAPCLRCVVVDAQDAKGNDMTRESQEVQESSHTIEAIEDQADGWTLEYDALCADVRQLRGSLAAVVEQLGQLTTEIRRAQRLALLTRAKHPPHRRRPRRPLQSQQSA